MDDAEFLDRLGQIREALGTIRANQQAQGDRLTRVEREFREASARIGRIELELHGSGINLSAKVERLMGLEPKIAELLESLNDLGDRLELLECRTERAGENAELRRFVNFLSAFPGGLRGIAIAWAFLTVTLHLVSDTLLSAETVLHILGL